MQMTDKSFIMGYGITNTTWNDNKKWAYLDLTNPNNNPAKGGEVLPQGQFYNFKPVKGVTYTQSILIDTDATFNPNGAPSNTWFTTQGHNLQQGYFEKLSETTYRFWSTYTWQLEDIALRAFDWYELHRVLDFRNSGTYLAFYKPKLEAGERPSNWDLAPEDLGWSATTLVPTQTQRYLWKFEYIYYSDGSIKVTQPTNISIAGAPGADGKTSYFHMAYANSADGKVGFSFTESGQQYQGYYTDFIQANSTDPTKYTWMDRRAGVEVGFRNLLTQTNQGKTKWRWSISSGGTTAEDYNVDGINAVKLTRTIDSSASWSYIQYQGLIRNLIEPNTKYTLSFDVFPSQDVTFIAALVRGNASDSLTNSPTMNKATANQWNKVSCVLTSVATLPNISDQVVYLRGMPTAKDNYLIIKNIKLEKGNIPTSWSPALEDTQADIDNKADQALTQDQLNALTEKNNLIKAEMEAKASIDTVNQWISAYQNYVKANDDAQDKSEKALQDASARLLQLNTDVGALKQQWTFIDTYMTVQNEGLIIGKSDGSAYAKFANDRISLFSGGSEVMYISQGVLRIENGIFTKTIQIGRFRFETHPADKDTLVLRYLGGV